MLASALLILAGLSPDSLVYVGRDKSLAVHPPRFEEKAVVDGVLDEPVWDRAARLTGFSSYYPTDDRPAPDSTEVLIWYSPTALHVGIRASAARSDVRATLATRDNLQQDDVVMLFLSTFNDGRQAYVFGVNPLGVQLDGVLSENGTAASSGFFGGLAGGRQAADPSPDFVYESKGRVTVAGFEVELEIPFKSIRYQNRNEQTWGIHVERTHRATGAVSSWVPAKRDAASYLGQAGQLVGLTDLRRGLVLDVTPVVTSTATGQPGAGNDWNLSGGNPRFGADVRWGMTTDLTASGTVRPDFSQVESDAGQVSFDPRSALFFPEKRPFFLEGSELFETPKSLVYTRRVVEPVAATKLAGKVGAFSLGALAAVDDQAQSADGRHNPVFAVTRLLRDLGAGSRLGLVYTGRYEADRSNHVAGVDTRLTFGSRVGLNLQVAGSRTTTSGVDRNGALWNGALAISGRRFNFRYSIDAISTGFRTQSGFIGRGAVANARFINQINFYGRPGGLVERASFDFSPLLTWRYQDLVEGRAAQDHKYHFNVNTRLRGGWGLSGSFLYEYQKFDPDLYADYVLIRPGVADSVRPFDATPELKNVDGVASLTTPNLGGFSGYVSYVWGRDVNFFEWARADIKNVNLGVNWRPSEQLRLDGSYILQEYRRHSDGSTVGRTHLPRVKAEYQVSRALFLRVVGEYRADRQDALRDDGRTEDPIAVFDPATNTYQRIGAAESKVLRVDWLLAFQPSPGTVLFAGYGSTRLETLESMPRGLRRVGDGLFVKLSYLFRM
ncbi:MAG: DUF5916 domain-containing protein [Gemmatimonadales bacterium]